MDWIGESFSLAHICLGQMVLSPIPTPLYRLVKKPVVHLCTKSLENLGMVSTYTDTTRGTHQTNTLKKKTLEHCTVESWHFHILYLLMDNQS
jgi:hypothetical protein